MGILNFDPKIGRKVKKYVTRMNPFFCFLLSSFWLVADRVIFDIGWVVDKVCVYTMKDQW